MDELSNHDCIQDQNIIEIKESLSIIKKDLKEIKDFWNFMKTGNKLTLSVAKFMSALGVIFYAIYKIRDWFK